MKLLIIRHGKAEDREVYHRVSHERSDHLRPLTKEGKKQWAEVSQWLQGQVSKIDEIWTSPLVRAQETTQILQKYYSKASVYEKQELEPQNPPEKILQVLDKFLWGENTTFQESLPCVAIVGHEPHLSQTLCELISTPFQGNIGFKKAGIAMVNFSGHHGKGQSELKWLVTPKLVLKK